MRIFLCFMVQVQYFIVHLSGVNTVSVSILCISQENIEKSYQEICDFCNVVIFEIQQCPRPAAKTNKWQ